MDLGDVRKTAEELKEKAEGLIQSTLKNEAKTDSALDSVAGAAKKATDDKIDAARDAADSKLGSE